MLHQPLLRHVCLLHKELGAIRDKRCIDACFVAIPLHLMQNGDVGATPGFDGDHAKALASITAKTLVMPAERDLYFPVADEEYEVSKMANAELRVIPGIWGHFAGGGANADDTKFIDNAVQDLLGTRQELTDSSRFANLSVSA